MRPAFLLFKLAIAYLARSNETNRQAILRWCRAEFSSWELEDEEDSYSHPPRDYSTHPLTEEEKASIAMLDAPNKRSRTFYGCTRVR